MARRGESHAGTYYMPHPLDFAILKRLPCEGSQLGFHTIAATVKRLVEDINKEVPDGAPAVTTGDVQSRMRSMHVAGYVVDVAVMGTGTRRGWQRTRKGELLYAEQTGETLPAQLQTVRSVNHEREEHGS